MKTSWADPCENTENCDSLRGINKNNNRHMPISELMTFR